MAEVAILWFQLHAFRGLRLFWWGTWEERRLAKDAGLRCPLRAEARGGESEVRLNFARVYATVILWMTSSWKYR